jgi:hypothetical protein
MQRTEKKGPYSFEYDGDLVVVRSMAHFTPERTSKIGVERQGLLYVTRPFVLNSGDKLILSCVGYDDVVVEGGGAA